jgi:hypothetical protein
MLGPIRPSLPAVRPAPRPIPTGASAAYAQLDRQAAERERLSARRSAEQHSVEWRVREEPGGSRVRVRRWTVDAGDGSGERTVHIDAVVD